MHFTPILAAAEKANTSFMDALPHLAGMLMVMISLAILWGICASTAKLIRIFIPEGQPAAAPVVKHAASAATATDPQPAAQAPCVGITPEIVAAIAAAVAAATGRSHRIISIKPMSTSWERAGRQSVLTSHRIR
jgi:Na+-transporting methylmalonyl-CoA/oxaloacetate decarboxylase gamma subunit